ncbi:hypothetical protein GCM10028824_27500 [Hymenobacter segetis]
MLVLLGATARAQAPDWQQALAITTATGSTSEVTATAVDASGNVYVAGSFQGTVGFGSVTLTSAVNYAGFVAKWDPTAGTWVWAQPLATTQSAYVTTLAVQGTSLYVGGLFIDAITLGNITLAGAGSYRGFVAKLSDSGPTARFVWAQAIGGTAYDYVLGLAVQGSSVYVVGALSSPTVSFGPATVTNSGYSTGFVAKLLDAGASASYAWVQAVGSPGQSRLGAVAVLGANVYVAGSFAGPATCGSTTLASSSTNDTDVLVARLTDAGTSASFAWARQAGGTGPDRATALAVAGSSVYVAGDVASATNVFGSTSLASLGRSDAFVAKLTDSGPTGSFAWAQLAGGAGYEAVTALAVQAPSVYLSGYATSAQARFGTTTLAGLGDYDAFAARLLDAGSSGSFVWARQAGSSGSDEATTLVLRGTQVVVGGYAAGRPRFGPLVLGTAGTATFGFLATITDAAALAVAPRLLPAGAVSLFPNPAHGTATVQLHAGTGPAVFTIIDAQGRTLRTQTTAPDSNAALDLTGFAPGLYAVRVAAGGRTATHRLVVE